MLGERLAEELQISPPAWGWPDLFEADGVLLADFPTRVGMARCNPASLRSQNRFPHPRGDGPLDYQVVVPADAISPPAWGWPGIANRHRNARNDFPTRVGMARADEAQTGDAPGFPHPRGDGPIAIPLSARLEQISPPAWGWPGDRRRKVRSPKDFPTRVGMARNHQVVTSPHQ